jgi:hypothetical protein
MGKDTFPWVKYIFPCAGCHSHQDLARPAFCQPRAGNLLSDHNGDERNLYELDSLNTTKRGIATSRMDCAMRLIFARQV